MTDTSFHKVADAGDIELGEGARYVVQGKAIAIFNVDGCFHAIDDRCSHGDASLAEGWLEGCEIECPLHQGKFDVTTGRATGAPCIVDIASYPLHVEDGTISVGIVETA